MTMASIGMKRAVAAGIAVLALGGAALAFGSGAGHTVAAQSAPAAGPGAGQQQAAPNKPDAAQDRHQQFLATLAAKLNVTPDRLKQALEQTRQELGLPQGPGGRPGGPSGGPDHRGFGPGPGMFGMGLDVAAQAMNISPDQLRQELPGKSLADVAKAHNVDPKKVSDALKAAAATHIDQAVTNGRLSADQAAQIKQHLSDRIDQEMTHQVPADAPLRGGPRH